jgi:choline dehydrogenase-like flavoprotein
MKNKQYTAIVIGAGAGGGVVAKELAVSGIKVVLFERGDWPSYDKHINDELISQRVQDLGSAFGPDWEKNPRVVRYADEREKIVTAQSYEYNHVAACVGSGTVSYGAMAWRFMPEDFKMKSTYGEVKGSTLTDWPITYEELAPFYDQAEREIGVSGDMSSNPFAANRDNPYPMPAFEFNKDGAYLADVCRKMGLHPFSIPMLRNSVPYNGRAGCIRNRTCCGFACPVDAKNGTQNTVIPVAMQTGNCEVKTNCFVYKIHTDEKHRATAVSYFDEKKRVHRLDADIIVVCASASETARLLLNSKSKGFPKGIGNENDWVGRNLQGHAYTGASGLFDFDILDLAGPGACMAINDYNHHNEGIIGGGLLANEFYQLPYAFSQHRPPGAARWGIENKRFQRENYFRLGRMIGPIQEMPNWESRVMVSDKVKDFWGVPVVVNTGERHPLDEKQCDFLSSKAENILKEAGAVQTWKHGGGRGMTGGQHQAGTCRMGDDPATSVVDRYGRVHDMDNLYIADGSVMVNNGGFNPALTILALAFRTGNHIVKEWTGGER